MLETRIRPTAPVALVRPRPLGGHAVFAAVLGLAAALRVCVMLGYRPARLYYYDSYTYLTVAAHPDPAASFQPSGYPFFLALLRPFHSAAMIAATQHALGLLTGVLVYALLRRRGRPAWVAIAATVPPLFDASFLQIEHAVLGDTLFIFLIVAATTALLWSPNTVPLAVPLLVAAALTRTIAVPLLLAVLAYMLLRRRPWVVLAGVLPLVLYASWYASVHGRFTLAGGDGVALWGRTMTFANCHVIQPPSNVARLCPNGAHQDAASEYIWDPRSSLNRLPGDHERNNALARSFALRAIAAQPLDYARAVVGDVSLTFHWTPARHPRRVTPAYGFARNDDPPPDNWLVRAGLRAYGLRAERYRSVEPYAGFLRGYQYPAYLRGPMLGAILLLGLRRRSLLPWGVAAGLLVLPVAVLDFDHRYVLPVVPVACLAAGLGYRSESWRPAL